MRNFSIRSEELHMSCPSGNRIRRLSSQEVEMNHIAAVRPLERRHYTQGYLIITTTESNDSLARENSVALNWNSQGINAPLDPEIKVALVAAVVDAR